MSISMDYYYVVYIYSNSFAGMDLCSINGQLVNAMYDENDGKCMRMIKNRAYDMSK